MTGRAFSSRTVRLYEDYVNEFFNRHSQLSAQSLEAALNQIPATSISKRQNFFKALVCFGKYLIRQKALEPEFQEQVKILSPKRHLPPKRHSITPEQLEEVINATVDLQDRLLVQLLASTGIRNAEACSLRRADIDLVQGTLLVRCGKGGKQRRLGLSSTTIALLYQYLAVNNRAPDSPLFLNTKGKTMGIDGLYQRIERIGQHAAVKLSPHVLRRAFVTHNANNSKPLQMLQIACGHADIKTTMSYCRTTEQEVIEAMKGW